MKSGRNTEVGESLQLLVDPMCNLFAGLILLSVFLALFAGRNQGDSRVEPGEETRFANEELLKKRTQETRDEVERLGKENQAMAERISPDSSLPALDAVEKALAEADQASRQEPAISRERMQLALEAEVGRLQKEVASLENEAAGLQKETLRLQERQRLLGGEMSGTRALGGQVRLRLPRARPTEKIPLYLLISGGKVFPAQLPSGAEDETHVERQRSPEEDRVFPRADKGISPGKDTEQFLRQMDGSRCYPVLVVYADSFPQYLAVRRKLEQMDLSFGWEPRENGAALRLSAHGFKPEAQ